MRLRILDLNTPWFWLTMFFNRPSYGKPKFELSIWGPHKWRNWWVYAWKWEKLECERESAACAIQNEAIADRYGIDLDNLPELPEGKDPATP